MMLNQQLAIFGSQIKAQEILFLLHDLKAVVRQGFSEQELPAIVDFCKKNNLFLVKSRFKVLFADQEKFSNKGLRVTETDQRQGMLFVYISKDERKALLAAYAEQINDHQQLGKLLGYPQCCVDFFCKNFSESNPNPIHLPTDIYTDLTKRELDAVLISHFPCSSECQKSIVIGKRNLELLQKITPERAKELQQILSK